MILCSLAQAAKLPPLWPMMQGDPCSNPAFYAWLQNQITGGGLTGLSAGYMPEYTAGGLVNGPTTASVFTLDGSGGTHQFIASDINYPAYYTRTGESNTIALHIDPNGSNGTIIGLAHFNGDGNVAPSTSADITAALGYLPSAPNDVNAMFADPNRFVSYNIITSTDTLSPNITGKLYQNGTYNSLPTYRTADSLFWLWSAPSLPGYCISTGPATTGSAYWTRTNSDPNGSYSPAGTATGHPVISLSNSPVAMTSSILKGDGAGGAVAGNSAAIAAAGGALANDVNGLRVVDRTDANSRFATASDVNAVRWLNITSDTNFVDSNNRWTFTCTGITKDINIGIYDTNTARIGQLFSLRDTNDAFGFIVHFDPNSTVIDVVNGTTIATAVRTGANFGSCDVQFVTPKKIFVYYAGADANAI